MTKAQLVGLKSITGRLDTRSSGWTYNPRMYKHPRFHSRAFENATRERKPKQKTISQTSVSVTATAPALAIRG